ncbi:MAG TPA: type II secretion system protein N [Sphingomicrobium sp.]|nr:type II secretion system protein N [Sphingomicrobium sp.]
MIRTLMVERWSLFRRWLPTDVYLWLKAILLALIAIQLARLLWAVLAPVGPMGPWRPAQARLLSPEVQATVLAAIDPFYRNGPPAASVEAASTLDLQLFGVRENRGSGGGAAIIGAPDGEQGSYAVGEEVSPGVTLSAVYFDYVVLDRGGRKEKLFLDQSKPGEMVAGGAAAPGPSSSAPAAAGAQPLTAAAARQAFSFAPRQQNGRVTGVVVAPGSDQGLYAAAGFQPGDVIVAVNGARIASQTDLIQLQSGLVPGARLSLTVERGAQTVPIALNLAGN